MKIAFLVPRLTPQKDGIGDVTRRLVNELRKCRIECLLISWNEDFTGERNGDYCFQKEVAWEERGIQALLKKFSPDWVSLQFIHYAFDSRGLMFDWNKKIERSLRPYRLHLFFHEIWIGVHQDASWKHRILGYIQKKGILKMVGLLKPDRIQTSNPPYREILQKNGWTVSVCRHCPGIVPSATDDRLGIFSAIDSRSKRPISKERDASFWFLIFGAIHPEALLENFLPFLIKWGKENQKTPVLISSGRQAPGEKAWESYQTLYEGKIEFVKLGEIDSNFVSGLMKECDFGVTTTPYQILGKSSVVVAMLEHGMPVLAYRDQRYGLPSDAIRGFHPGVIDPEEVLKGEVKNWLEMKKSISYETGMIAEIFLKTLNQANA